MKTRKLIATAAALVLAVQAGFATNISGVTGVDGVYNINPEKVNGSTGFRHYENFRLSEKDIANLIMQYGTKDLNTFINMVDGKIDIQGVLNTARNGNFANGHAVFISPNGMVVGASGVLNVGSLSVLTPTQDKYKNLLNDGAAINLDSIKNEAHADILIRGKVLARGDVNIQGADVALPETSAIISGVSKNSLVKSQEDVNSILFDSLVNTKNLRAADHLTNESGKIVIRANSTDKMLNVRGTVINYNSGDIQLTNNGGEGGLKVTGTIANADGNITLVNDTGKTLIKGSLENDGGTISISDKGEGIHLNSGSSITANTGKIYIKNEGTNGLYVNGNVDAADSLVLDNANGDLTINTKITSDNGISLQNTGNKLSISSKGSVINDAGNLVIKNSGNNGALIYGKVENNGDTISIKNTAGDLNINGNINAKSGNLGIINEGGDILYIKNDAVINVADGKANIVNSDGKNGLYILGKFTSEGDDVLVQNGNGKVYVDGTVQYDGAGSLQIINNAKDSQLMIAKTGKVSSANDAMLKNDGADGLFVNGTVNADNVLVLDNTKGDLTVNNAITAGNGLSVQNSGNKLSISSKGSVINDNGNLVIKNSGANGALIYGKVENDGATISIKNTAGDLNINGNINAKSGDLGIINEGGDILYIKNDAVINVEDGKTNIVNSDGKNGLYVLGKFTGNGDDVLVQNGSGKVYIDGDVQYDGVGTLQIINNAKDSQLMIAKTGKVHSANDVMIKNDGSEGLYVNGTVNADNALVLNNTKGDLTINNKVTAGNGLSIQNSGNKLAISSKGSVINDDGDLVIKNSGANGIVSYGNIENNGDTISITNTAGDLNINGKVTAKSGDIGIINDGNRLYLKDKSVITNKDGETNIVNNGKDGLKAVGTINVDSENLNIQNSAGQGYIDGTITSEGGNINILSKGDSKGMYIRTNANITNIPKIETDVTGKIVIQDTASEAGGGLIIKGTIKVNKDIVISSANNNIYTKGTVDAGNNLDFYQSAKDGVMTFHKDAKTIAGGNVTYTVENGSKINDMRN